MKRYAEIECAICEEIIAHIEIAPEHTLVHGEAFCPDCFEDSEET